MQTPGTKALGAKASDRSCSRSSAARGGSAKGRSFESGIGDKQRWQVSLPAPPDTPKRYLRRLYRIARICGIAVAADCVKIKLSRRDSVRSIHPVGAVHPLWARTRSTDLSVFEAIFSEREYECLNLIDGDLILDLGANVGYSSAYFLSRYRKSPVVAVEPDPDNFAILQRNLAPYVSRANVI